MARRRCAASHVHRLVSVYSHLSSLNTEIHEGESTDRYDLALCSALDIVAARLTSGDGGSVGVSLQLDETSERV